MCTTVKSNNKLFAGYATFLLILLGVEHLVSFLKVFYAKYSEKENEFFKKEKENDIILKAHIDKQNKIAAEKVLDGTYMKERKKHLWKKIQLSNLMKGEFADPNAVEPDELQKKRVNYMYNHYGD